MVIVVSLCEISTLLVPNGKQTSFTSRIETASDHLPLAPSSQPHTYTLDSRRRFCFSISGSIQHLRIGLLLINHWKYEVLKDSGLVDWISYFSFWTYRAIFGSALTLYDILNEFNPKISPFGPFAVFEWIPTTAHN